MNSLLTGSVKSVTLPEQEAGIARTSSDALAHFVDSESQPLTLRLDNTQTGHHMEAIIPATAVRFLADILAKLSEGQPVTLIALESELSTQQAAELLGVSRPYFVKLLEEGNIPFRKVGEQRRVRYSDLLKYTEEYQQEATSGLDQMTQDAELLGLYAK